MLQYFLFCCYGSVLLDDKALAVARLLAGHRSSLPSDVDEMLPPAPCCDAVLVVVGGRA